MVQYAPVEYCTKSVFMRNPSLPPQTKRCDWCPTLFFADWWLLDLPWPFLWSYHINILKNSQVLFESITDLVQYAPAVHCTKFVLMRKTMESVWSTVGFGRDSMWKLRKMRFKEAAYLAYLGSAQQIYKKFTAFRVWNHENCVQWWSLKIQHTWSAEQYALNLINFSPYCFFGDYVSHCLSSQ